MKKSDLGILSSHMGLVVIYPFLALIYSIFIFFTRRHVYSVYLLSLSLAIFSSIYIPNSDADLSRWFLIYESIADGGIGALLNWLSTRPDSLSYIYIYITSSLGLSKEILAFTVIFLSYSIYLHIFECEVKDKNICFYHYFMLAMLFVCALDHRVILLGVRQGLAIVVCILGLSLYLKGKIKIAAFLFTIAISIHFMSMAIVGIFLVSKFINHKYQKGFLCLSLLIFILPFKGQISNIVNIFIPILSSESSAILETYTVGYWGQEYANDLSEKGKIQALITMLPILISYGYLFLFKDNSYYRNALTLSLLLVSIVSFSDTLLLRYLVVPTLLLPVCLVGESRVKLKEKLIIVLPTYILLFAAMIYSSRHSIALTSENFILMSVFHLVKYNVVPYN
ncbi:hypothetical protein GU271_02550 [Vibrio cholerae]|uniref:EpsG family protein n=1 Tax=Vibrio cholerae TaxID=666 RepID=UPI000E0BA83D|nr:EpsG family protein [Vibrio cholerae]NOE55528.1 hypothetical protein [Vibrio cholerae]